MGNACSCVSKNKEPVGETNQTINREENGSQVKEEIKKETAAEQNAAVSESKVIENCNTTSTESQPAPSSALQPYPEAPDDFKVDVVEPVGKDTVPDEDEIPDSEQYEIPTKQLDDLAIELGKHSFPSFNSLVYHLLHKRSDNNTECKDSDFLKVCALFTWLTTKNLHDLKSIADEIPPESPEGVLLGISSGKTAYAQVFQLLCRHAGLQCKLIRGYAKGVDYKPGMKLGGGKEAQHAWNAVKIDKKWYLFDCHWAARRLMGKSVNSDRIKYDLDLFYFMTNPVQLRYTHFPFEEDWQLVKKRITLEDFENLTLIKPTFFKYGLELHSHNQAVLEVQDGLVLKIKIPCDLVEKICLTFTLTLEGLGEIYEGSNLTRYGMQEMNKSSGVCVLNFRFPKSGAYKLLLYAREFGDQIFGGICEYKINCKLPEKEVTDTSGEKHMESNKVRPYPPTQQPAYGKTEMAAQYNLKCAEDNQATIRVSDGQMEIAFLKEKQDMDNFPRLMARLKSSYHDDSKLSSRILQRNTYADNKIDKFIVLAFLPDAGEYALEIYANNPDKEGSSFFLVWQLLLATDHGTELPPGLPDINPGAAIGAQTQFQELGLRCISHNDPYVVVPNPAAVVTVFGSSHTENSPEERHDIDIMIGLPTTSAVKVLGQLVDVSSEDEEKECSDYLLQQSHLRNDSSEVESVSFLVRVPRGGCCYKLHVYAAAASAETETLPMVFTYLLNAPHRLGSTDHPYHGSAQATYPYQLSQWKDRCRLYSPMVRNLKIDSAATDTIKIDFKLQVPDAFYLSVVVAGENWTQLTKAVESESVWSGEVPIDPQTPSGSKVAICACYNATIKSYNTILEFYTC